MRPCLRGRGNVAGRLADAHARLNRLSTDRRNLDSGEGKWAATAAGRAARHYQQVRSQHAQARQHAVEPGIGWRQRRRWAKTAHQLAEAEASARGDWRRDVEPVARRLDQQISDTRTEVFDLDRADQRRRGWLNDHPDHARRITHLERELLRIEDPDRAHLLDHLDQLDQIRHQPPAPTHDLGLGL